MTATQTRFSYDSNIRYLPLVYFLPDYLIAKFPTLRKLPRNVRLVLRDEAMVSLVESDQFLNEIMDASALLAFPHFGFKGWKEDYTGYFPIWQLSYALPIWAGRLEQETGFGLQALFNVPGSEEIAFFDKDFIKETMRRIVHRAIEEEEKWKDIIKIVRQIPCHEDFEAWNSNAKIDFYRKWNHSRAKFGNPESLDSYEHPGYDEDNDDGRCRYLPIRDFYTIGSEMESEDFYRGFKSTLNAKDLKIVELREEGLTYEEIAPKIGYKTHSAVAKKIKAIREAYQQYQGDQG